MKMFSCPILIVIAVCFFLTEASFPPNRYSNPDGYFFGTQSLTCVVWNNLWKKDSIPPDRFTLAPKHRLIYYRNAVYEFGPSGVTTHNLPDWQDARKCPVKWDSAPASTSNCSVQSLKNVLAGYIGRYGKYNVVTNNCHKFANRVSAFLFKSKCRL